MLPSPAFPFPITITITIIPIYNQYCILEMAPSPIYHQYCILEMEQVLDQKENGANYLLDTILYIKAPSRLTVRY